jgi:hypothetical protein
MDQVRPGHTSDYEASRLTQIISHHGEVFLFRTTKNWVVSLFLPDKSNGKKYRKAPSDFKNQTAIQLIHAEIQNERVDYRWLDTARSKLRNEHKLAMAFQHRHMHPVEYFCESTPALYMALPLGSLDELKHSFWWDKRRKKNAFSFTEIVTPRPHQPNDNMVIGASQTHIWYTVGKQLVDVTRFLLNVKNHAHLNLNPHTVLYQFVENEIHCWVTDYGSLELKSTQHNERWQSMENRIYTLPYTNQNAESHALAQLLSTLLDLIFFDLGGVPGFFIGDSAAPLIDYNIWSTIKAAVHHTDPSAVPSQLRPLRAIYDQLKRGTKDTPEINEYIIPALLFMTPKRDDGHRELNELLNTMFRALCDNFKL